MGDWAWIFQKQGPWGDLYILQNEDCKTVTSWVNDSPVNDIRGVQFIFNDCKLRQLLGFKIVFFHKGLRMETHFGGDNGGNNDWVRKFFSLPLNLLFLPNVVLDYNFVFV